MARAELSSLMGGLVAVDGCPQPLGGRVGADHHEQGIRWDGLAGAAAVIVQGQLFQPPGALPADRLGAQPDRDAGVALIFLDQVVGHGDTQRVAAGQHGDRCGVPG